MPLNYLENGERFVSTTMSYQEQSCQNDSVGYEENIIMRHVIIIIMIVLILKHKIKFAL